MSKRLVRILFWATACVALGFSRPVKAQPFPPSATLLQPTNGSVLYAGDVINLKADASDSDGTVIKVEFYANGMLVGEDSTAPFSAYWSNIVADAQVFQQEVFAVAVDDGFLRTTSAVAVVNVPNYSPSNWIYWNAATSREWNNVDGNWYFATAFHSGDRVAFNSEGQGVVFIGLEGTPFDVFPLKVEKVAFGEHILTGGDIASGSVEVSNGSLTFSNLTGRYSYPGGTTISGGGVTHDVSQAASNAVVRLGTGPIHLAGGSYRLLGAPGQQIILENDFTSSGLSGIGLYNTPGVTVRHTGSLLFRGLYYIMSGYDTNSPHDWMGPWTIDQTVPGDRLFNLSGSYTPQFIRISGNISDGPGTRSLPLSFRNYAVPKLTIAGTNNTYAHGTIVKSSPSAPKGFVEVAPHSSLGIGDVTVEFGGVLALTGNSNIANTASVRVDGELYIAQGVKVRVAQATIGSQSYTRALLSSNSHPFYITGGGSLRVGAINQPPSVTFSNISVPNYAGGDVPIRVTAADSDSLITSVELFVNDTLVATSTNSTLLYFITNAAAGLYTLRARAFDDDGAESTNVFLNVNVTAPPYPPGIVVWNDSGAWGREWNTRAPNWLRGNSQTHFISGDETWFDDERPGNVFIGQGGSRLDVRPTRVLIDSQFDYVFSGGRISGAPIEKAGSGTATFANYNTSFDVPHVFIRGGILELSHGLGARTFGFGQGSITLSNSTFRWKPIGAFNGQASLLTNHLLICGTGGTVSLAPAGHAKCVLSGDIVFSPGATLSIESGATGGTAVGHHELGGRIELSGTNLLARVSGHGNTSLALTGPIVDGGSGAALLVLSNSQPHALRILGTSNNWSGGTVIAGTTNNIVPTAADYSIEVAGQLGQGPVVVQSNALLRLVHGAALLPHQYLDLQGFAFVPTNIVITVSELRLGAVLHTSGVFSNQNSDGHIVGSGFIAVGAQPPWFVVHPDNQSSAYAGSVSLVSLAAGASPIALQWRKDQVPVSGATNESLSFSNLTRSEEGLYEVIAFNALGSATSRPARVHVIVPQRLQQLRMNGGLPIIWFGDAYGFGVPDSSRLTIQSTTNLIGTATVWSSISNPTVVLTNGLLQWEDSEATNHARRFYRIREE